MAAPDVADPELGLRHFQQWIPTRMTQYGKTNGQWQSQQHDQARNDQGDAAALGAREANDRSARYQRGGAYPVT